MSRSSITLSIATWIRSARSGSSLIATMPRWRARDQAEVDRLRVAEVATLGHLHRVHVTDQVGDAGVRGGQLLGVPLVAVSPLHRQVVAVLGGQAPGGVRDRLVGVLAELGAGDHRRPLVEQADQGAQQPGLALAALAEQDDVVAGEQRPLELRDHGGLEAVQAGPRVAALAQGGEQVVAQLLAQRLQLVAAGAELADGADRRWGGRHPRHATQPANRAERRVLRHSAGWTSGAWTGRAPAAGASYDGCCGPLAPRGAAGADAGGADALAVHRLRDGRSTTTSSGPGTRGPGPRAWPRTRPPAGPRSRSSSADERRGGVPGALRGARPPGVLHERSRFSERGRPVVLPRRRRRAPASRRSAIQAGSQPG